MRSGECVVRVVCLPNGLGQGCRVCRKVLISGNYLIQLQLQDGEREYSYFLGVPPFSHCGEEKHFFQCFKTEEAVLVEVDRVNAHLRDTGSTEGLWLTSVTLNDLPEMLSTLESN